MDIMVVTDDSMEGHIIKTVLEQENMQNKIRGSFFIRWGNWWDEEYGKIILNSSHSIRNTLNKENMIMMLRKNHIRCPRKIKPGRKTRFPVIGRKYSHQNGEDIKIIDSIDEAKKSDCDYFLQYLDIKEEFRVHVMDLKAFYVEEKFPEGIVNLYEPVIRNRNFGWGFRKIDLLERDRDGAGEIMELAIKAVHSLGLDFGVVNMAVTFDDKYYVLDIDASCRYMSGDCRKAYISQFLETLYRYEDLLSGIGDITLGADIECVIKDNETNELLYASDFFCKEGHAGFDNRSIEAGRKYFPILEIRPDCSKSPIEVVNSIKQILDSIRDCVCYENIGIYAGSMPVYNYWVGGHIHFGIKPNSRLLRTLDNYLALPVMMIERACLARDRKTKYGQLSDFRLKSHGGFEYRTLSSWIINPEIATAVLCLAKVIAQEHLNLSGQFLRNYYDIRAYYSGNKSCFTQVMESIVRSIECTETFKLYNAQIRPFFQKVMAIEEWNEDKPINEAWKMLSNGKVFKPSDRCFIPQKKRDEIGIDIEDTAEIVIGRRKYRLQVYPKDNNSPEGVNDICFSAQVCQNIGIEESDCLNLWYDSHFNALRAGPVLGILSDIENCEFGPFGNQSLYFRKLVKFSKSKGMITYVFTIYDIEWERGRVKGYTYNFKEDKWKEQYFPVPDVIYDRGDVVSNVNYGQHAVKFINSVKKMNIKFINSLGCINLINDKWLTYKVLKSCNKTKKYLPYTVTFQHNEQVGECIQRYGHIFIKIRNGSMGKAIFSVKRLGKDNYEITCSDRFRNVSTCKANSRSLLKIINGAINELGCKKTAFIIQRAVSFAKYKNNNFEVRVVMQKNSRGLWLRTCMIARCWTEGGVIINPESEINIGAVTVLEESLGSNAEQVIYRIRKASRDIVTLMDDMGIQAGEVAIDFAVDNSLNIFIIELNSKPDNLLASIRAYKMRNLVINRMLEYAKYLVAGNSHADNKSTGV